MMTEQERETIAVDAAALQALVTAYDAYQVAAAEHDRLKGLYRAQRTSGVPWQQYAIPYERVSVALAQETEALRAYHRAARAFVQVVKEQR